MKVMTLDNLRELLGLMKGTFGNRELPINHRNTLNTYILNISDEYNEDLELDSDFKDIVVSEDGASSVLGVGKLGIMTLGQSYAPSSAVIGVGYLGEIIL